MNTCIWIRPNDKLCGSPCEGNYCRNHQILVKAGYVRPERLDEKAEAATDALSEQRKKWKTELENDLAQGKTRKIKPEDFPRIINGIEFDSIAKYHEFYGKPKKKRSQDETSVFGRDGHLNLFDRVDDPYYSTSSNKSSWGRNRLDKEHYVVCEKIAHMRYVVYRDKEGFYYALFVSIYKTGTLEQIMARVAATQLPVFQPVSIEGVGGFHSREPHHGYNAAEAIFYKSHESVYRVRERMAKAANPKWIPPNLRSLAIEATYEEKLWDLINPASGLPVIPKEEHARLKAWLAADCPGWYGKAPVWGFHDKRKDKHNDKGGKSTKLDNVIPINSHIASSEDKPDEMVWDQGLGRYVKKQ